MEKLRAGVIGLGYMGRNHARIYADMDNVELCAVCDTDKAALGKISRRYHAIPYTNYSEMLENEKLDVVSIALPTDLHKEAAIEAMKKGISVLLEKPIASNTRDAKEIVEFANANKAKMMIGHVERFNPAVIELKKMIDAGKLGKVYKIEAYRCGPFPTRISDVGVVVDLAVHDLDVINYLVGLKIERMHAETERRIHPKHEDLLTALLKLHSNIVVSLNIDWLTPTKIRELRITGEKGMFVANYLTQDIFFYENNMYAGRFDYAETALGVTEGNMTKFMIAKKEPLLAEIESFINYVQKGTKPPVSIEDALKALEVAELLVSDGKNNKGC